MKGIFIPLLFAIFGGRAISEGNLPTGTDPNKVAEIYGKPQNTDPSKLSGAPITHERKLEVKGEEMSLSVTSPNNHDERRLPDVECENKQKGVINRTTSVICKSSQKLPSPLDLNDCLTNFDGELKYKRDGGYARSCRRCNFESKDTLVLKCECRKYDQSYRNATIDLNDYIVKHDNQLDCRPKIHLTTEYYTLEALQISSGCDDDPSKKCSLKIKECIDTYEKSLKNTEDEEGVIKNKANAIINVAEAKCKIDRRSIICEGKGESQKTETKLSINLDKIIKYGEKTLECIHPKNPLRNLSIQMNPPRQQERKINII